MSRQWAWFRPTDLDEAVGLLLEHGSDASLVAGGTSISLNPPRRDTRTMIDLQALGLKYIQDDEREIHLGAMVSAHQLESNESLIPLGSGMMRDVGTVMGPRPVRNRVTVGGNVMQVFRWSDLPVALLALDATFHFYGPKGRRSLNSDKVLETQPRKKLAPGELLTGVTIRKDVAGEGGAFLKLSMTIIDHALVSAAVRLHLENDVVRSVRVAVGALRAIPQRLVETENAILGQSLTESVLQAAAEAARSCEITTDRRADEEYRRDVTAILVRRAIVLASERARSSDTIGGGAC